MRKGLRTLTTVTALTILAAPAAAHAESSYGDPLRILHQPTSVIGASSGPDGLALRLFHVEADERNSVRYQDAQGRWHRFVVPGAAQTVRLAQLGDGGGLAAWDEGESVVVRTWDRAGTLAPARAVLTDAVTTWSGDFESPGWGLAYDGEGTVALASAAPGSGVIATVRDPGGGFAPQQRLVTSTDPNAPADSRDGGYAPSLAVSLAPGGAVSVLWGNHAEGPDAVRGRETGRATRAGRATTFGAAEAGPRPADPSLLTSDAGLDVRVGDDVLALCARVTCSKPRLFSWGSGEARIAFGRVDLQSDDPGRWYVASRQADGRFARPRLAFRGDANPIWTRTPGVIAFTRVSEGDSAGRERGVYLVPFGGASSKAAPRLFAQAAASRNGTLTVAAFCRTACRISARGFKSTRPLAPLEAGALTMRVPATRKLVRITLVARDARGRTIRLERTLRRGPLVTGSLRNWSVRR